MATSSLALPEYLYPAFAPLPIAFANHLVLLEQRLSRKKGVSEPFSSERLWKVVAERVRFARALVYEYMNPFVLVEQHRLARGLPRKFPEENWLIESLATYAPDGTRYSPATIELWQKKRLLRREKPRGMFELDSIAALLITRIAEGEHQRNWLPSELSAEQSLWWCYEQSGLAATRRPVALPLPTMLMEATIICTPWLGAGWLSQEWRVFHNVALRWNGTISSLQELEQWDPELAKEIAEWRSHPLLGKPAVQKTLLQEAATMILERAAP